MYKLFDNPSFTLFYYRCKPLTTWRQNCARVEKEWVKMNSFPNSCHRFQQLVTSVVSRDATEVPECTTGSAALRRRVITTTTRGRAAADLLPATHSSAGITTISSQLQTRCFLTRAEVDGADRGVESASS